MSEVLTPGFELLRGLAHLFTENGECVAETVRIEVGDTGTGKSGLEDMPNLARG